MASSENAVQLSSNWKKLQQQLNAEKHTAAPTESTSSSNQLKRKAARTYSNFSNSRHTRGLKRRKVDLPGFTKSNPSTGPSQFKPRPMGSYLSTLLPASNTPAEQAPLSSLQGSSSQTSLTTPKPGKYVALDCEMVGTHDATPFSVAAHTPRHPHPHTSTISAAAKPPEYSIVARVSLTSYTHETLYDSYVLPPPGVTVSDFRTPWSGITPAHLDPLSAAHAGNNTSDPSALADIRPRPPLRDFATVQRDVAALLDGRVLVGHALRNDLAVLGLSHPQRDIRDTARYPGYRALAGPVDARSGKVGGGGGRAKSRTPALKKLAREVLGWEIQGGAKAGHDSVEDARAAMELFRREKKGFEEEVARVYGAGAGIGTGGRGKKGDEGGGEDGEGEESGVGKKKPRKKKKKKKGRR